MIDLPLTSTRFRRLIKKMSSFSTSRTFNAPRSLVFDCWVQPERFEHWFSPADCETKLVSADVKPGGSFQLQTTSPDGKVFWTKHEFLEIEPTDRMVFLISFCDEQGNLASHPYWGERWPVYMMNTVTFEDKGSATKVSVVVEPHQSSFEQIEFFDDRRILLRAGWADTFDKAILTAEGEKQRLDLIAGAKKSAKEGMFFFLRNFSYVPDDRLNWSPTPTSKSPMRIAAHTALYYKIFAQMIQNRQLPVVTDLEAWQAEKNAAELALTDRVEMERVFREGNEAVLQALDSLTVKEVEMELDSGQGWTMPMTFLMALPGWHATLHLGQIDYLQTCWDDQEIYIK